MKEKTQKQKKKRKGLLFKIITRMISLFYGKVNYEGLENIPDEPCIIVRNHAQVHGPILAELKSPYSRYTWCIGNMLHIKEFPEYAFEEFWGSKPKYARWWYRTLAYMIAPIATYTFRNADVVGVYKDGRAMATFKNSLRVLRDEYNIVLFPECHKKYNNIINDFEDGFVSLGKLYFKSTGKEISFVPMYNAPSLKTVIYGKPIKYDSTKDTHKYIVDYLKIEITNLSKSLPRHRVIPYDNIPKKSYPYSQ